MQSAYIRRFITFPPRFASPQNAIDANLQDLIYRCMTLLSKQSVHMQMYIHHKSISHSGAVWGFMVLPGTGPCKIAEAKFTQVGEYCDSVFLDLVL